MNSEKVSNEQSSEVVFPYFAGTEVLNGTFNGTIPEDCGGETVTVHCISA